MRVDRCLVLVGGASAIAAPFVLRAHAQAPQAFCPGQVANDPKAIEQLQLGGLDFTISAPSRPRSRSQARLMPRASACASSLTK
jgi:hypothetical protein